MRAATLGRRLGDWLGLVPDDDSGASVPGVMIEETRATEDPSPGLDSAPAEAVAPAPKATTTATAPRPQRARRDLLATPEFDAELSAFQEAVRELRAGLEIDDPDES